MNQLERGVLRGKEELQALSNGKYTTVAGALSFFFVMSIVPFLFFFALAFGKIGLRAEAILEIEIFSWAKDLILLLLQNAESAAASRAGVLFLVTTLYSSSAFFYHLRRSGEILYGVKRGKGGVKVRLSAIGATLFVLLYFLLAITLLVGAIVLSRGLPRWASLFSVYALVFVIGFFASWILHVYICPYRCSASDILRGSFFTALSWFLLSVAFSIYYVISNKERLYGVLTLFIVSFLYLYWMMVCFTAGAVYNRRRMNLRALEKRKF